jgi:hypothetical protein
MDQQRRKADMNAGMGRRNVIWKTPDITASGLKLFACAAMFLQSVGIVIVQNGMIHLSQYTQTGLSEAMAEDSHLMMLAGIGSILQLIGGLAVPIFAFLLVEGFQHTSSYRNYLMTMLFFALVSEIPYDLAVQQQMWDYTSQNALVTMTVCLIMLYFLKQAGKQKNPVTGVLLRMLIVLGAIAWVTLLRAEFGLCMVLLVAIFYLFDTRNVTKTILGVLVSLLYVTGPLAFYGIWCYNGERSDRCSKYVFYMFYPLHLLMLGAIARFCLS